MGLYTCQKMPQKFPSGAEIHERSNRDHLGRFGVYNADGKLVKWTNRIEDAQDFVRKVFEFTR